MKFTDLVKNINKAIKAKPKKLKCFNDSQFLYCFCGKCKPKDYELPEDFQILIAKEAVKKYKKIKDNK